MANVSYVLPLLFCRRGGVITTVDLLRAFAPPVTKLPTSQRRVVYAFVLRTRSVTLLVTTKYVFTTRVSDKRLISWPAVRIESRNRQKRNQQRRQRVSFHTVGLRGRLKCWRYSPFKRTKETRLVIVIYEKYVLRLKTIFNPKNLFPP